MLVPEATPPEPLGADLATTMDFGAINAARCGSEKGRHAKAQEGIRSRLARVPQPIEQFRRPAAQRQDSRFEGPKSASCHARVVTATEPHRPGFTNRAARRP